MRTSTHPPFPGEPQVRGSVIHGFRSALVDIGGESALDGLAARLPLATRVATVDALVLPFEWVPLDHVIAWHEALWTGPCGADEQALAKLIGRSIELGLGRFKSAFFAAITPERLAARARELWRSQHTHGELSAVAEATSGMVILKDHPYVDQPTSRRVVAESYRHVVTMAGGRDVRAAWGDRLSGPASRARELVVQLSWRTA